MLQLLYKVMQPSAVYRGVIITKNDGCYKVFENEYPSLEQAKAVIDASFKIIAASIKQAGRK